MTARAASARTREYAAGDGEKHMQVTERVRKILSNRESDIRFSRA